MRVVRPSVARVGPVPADVLPVVGYVLVPLLPANDWFWVLPMALAVMALAAFPDGLPPLSEVIPCFEKG